MKELINIQTKLVAPKDLYNAFGKYKYRSAESILEALKPLLKEESCFLTIVDEVVMVGDRYYVKATASISNEAGDFVQSVAYAREEQDKKGMDAAQITGATSSYARKYALNGLFAIDDTKDPDATNTDGQEQQTQPKPQAKPQAKAKAVEVPHNNEDGMPFDPVERAAWISESKTYEEFVVRYKTLPDYIKKDRSVLQVIPELKERFGK